jgi:arylsulfate sulfotransferase
MAVKRGAMKIPVRVLIASIGFVVTLASLGCGSSTTTPPPVGTVAASTHPLVAQYDVMHYDSEMSAWVEFGTDTNYGRQTSVVTGSSPDKKVSNHKVSILVAGMKPQTSYHMRAHVKWQGGEWVDQDRTFKSGAIPSSQLLPTFTVSQPTQSSDVPSGGIELLSLVSSLSGYLNAVATDLKGNVIWYCPGAAIPVKPMNNGHYLLNSGTDWLEVDLACNTVRDVSVAQVNQLLQASGNSIGPVSAFHHDMLVLPNGHWILLATVYKEFSDLAGYPGTTNVLGDALLDVDLEGNVVWAWSTFDHLAACAGASLADGCYINRHLQGLPDWTHSNALVYTADGNLLLSVRHQSWILKIDYSNGNGSGNILWKLGDEGDFTLLGGDRSQWFYAQHYPNVLSENGSETSLAIFDNGNLRIDSNGDACGSSTSAPACYTRAVIYQIDESKRTAELLWEDLPGYFSNWGGSISVLGDNVEFNMSNPFNQAASEIMEVSQKDKQMVWQMTINGVASYRGYRIPSLYPGVTWPQ